MLDFGGNKQRVAGPKRYTLASTDKYTSTVDNDVHFILIVRCLQIRATRCIKPQPHRAVRKQLRGSSPLRNRSRAGSIKRYFLYHSSPLSRTQKTLIINDDPGQA